MRLRKMWFIERSLGVDYYRYFIQYEPSGSNYQLTMGEECAWQLADKLGVKILNEYGE